MTGLPMRCKSIVELGERALNDSGLRNLDRGRLVKDARGLRGRGGNDDAGQVLAGGLLARLPFQHFVAVAVLEAGLAVLADAAEANEERFGLLGRGVPDPERLPIAGIRSLLPLRETGADGVA